MRQKFQVFLLTLITLLSIINSKSIKRERMTLRPDDNPKSRNIKIIEGIIDFYRNLLQLPYGKVAEIVDTSVEYEKDPEKALATIQTKLKEITTKEVPLLKTSEIGLVAMHFFDKNNEIVDGKLGESLTKKIVKETEIDKSKVEEIVKKVISQKEEQTPKEIIKEIIIELEKVTGQKIDKSDVKKVFKSFKKKVKQVEEEVLESQAALKKEKKPSSPDEGLGTLLMDIIREKMELEEQLRKQKRRIKEYEEGEKEEEEEEDEF